MLQVDTLKLKAVFRTKPCASCTRRVTTSVSTSAATAVIKRSKWKCMMAGAFTSAPANHAKTEWPPDINPHLQASVSDAKQMDPGLPSLLTRAAEMSVTLSHENARTTKAPHFTSAALARASLQGMDG